MKKLHSQNLVPLQYWRAALAEINLCHPEIPLDDKPIIIAEANGYWSVSKAEPSPPEWVTNQFATSKSASKDRPDGKAVATIPFVLVAASLSIKASHGIKSDAEDINGGLSLLCVPCLLDRDGRLLPDTERHPWIPRDLLKPSLGKVTVGDLDSYDHFLSTIPGKPITLNDVFETASNMFERITAARLPMFVEYEQENSTLPMFERNGYEVVSAWHGMPYDPPIIARHLIKLYDQLIDNTPETPLLEKLRDTSDRRVRSPILITKAEAQYSASYGHINKKHALSSSQREAMTELVVLKTGEVLAVNGPPGTGKTTLLQSVVAQLWVDAALRQVDCPLILVTSTNVKAVENVLDSFAKIEVDIGHKRWLPYRGGFGLFMASASRESTFPTCTGDTHPFIEFEKVDSVKLATKTYLEYASAHFGRAIDSVKTAVQALHAELTGYQKSLKSIIRTHYAVLSATGGDGAIGAATLCTRFKLQYAHDAVDANVSIEAIEVKIAQCVAQSAELEGRYEAARAMVNAAEGRWSQYLAATSNLLEIFSFLPWILRRRNALDRAFFLSEKLATELNNRQEDVSEHFSMLRKRALAEKQVESVKLTVDRRQLEDLKVLAGERLRNAEEGFAQIERLEKAWFSALGRKYEQMADMHLVALNEQLDIAIRALMFCLADRYWSGMWLLEVQEMLDKQIKDSVGRKKLEVKYRRFAKISPCLVSNFHMCPKFFTAWEGKDYPLWNSIDLLIVDEAGQVAPDVGSGMFALAKRALVVGDTYQIEPVWNAEEVTDRPNAVKFKLTSSINDQQYDELAIAGYTAAQGNLMKIAGRGCSIQKYNDVRGLLLTEHRRCVPELVAFCNELVYAGRLQSLRSALDPAKRLFPAYGVLDVHGRGKKVGSSRQNYDEAAAIVDWLKANRERIENHYRDKETGEQIPLWKLVGVVTPFKTQANVIERQLRKVMPDLVSKKTKLTVGTVHALQGAEREIVIFSPTYGHEHSGGMFFDRSPNMLNVAVSRAKDTFMVIGNLALFDKTKRSKPSGLLATYLPLDQRGQDG